jgi:hypothetical protein
MLAIPIALLLRSCLPPSRYALRKSAIAPVELWIKNVGFHSPLLAITSYYDELPVTRNGTGSSLRSNAAGGILILMIPAAFLLRRYLPLHHRPYPLCVTEISSCSG